ncbi:hypothetical protein V8C86DRAFT_3030448, partial [Haematococcus lacustris]
MSCASEPYGSLNLVASRVMKHIKAARSVTGLLYVCKSCLHDMNAIHISAALLHLAHITSSNAGDKPPGSAATALFDRGDHSLQLGQRGEGAGACQPQHRALLTLLLLKLHQTVYDMDSSALAAVVFALGSLKVHDPAFMLQLANLSEPGLHTCSSRQLVMLVEGLAGAHTQPSSSWLASFYSASLAALQQQSLQPSSPLGAASSSTALQPATPS